MKLHCLFVRHLNGQSSLGLLNVFERSPLDFFFTRFPSSSCYLIDIGNFKLFPPDWHLPLIQLACKIPFHYHIENDKYKTYKVRDCHHAWQHYIKNREFNKFFLHRLKKKEFECRIFFKSGWKQIRKKWMEGNCSFIPYSTVWTMETSVCSYDHPSLYSLFLQVPYLKPEHSRNIR